MINEPVRFQQLKMATRLLATLEELPGFVQPSPQEEEAIKTTLTTVNDALLALLFSDPESEEE